MGIRIKFGKILGDYTEFNYLCSDFQDHLIQMLFESFL